jgi:excinuclease UvrABC nuclease subunit
MGRCCSPCLGDLDPNAYRRQLERALSVFSSRDARAALLAQLDAWMNDAARDHRFERAAALLRRRERLDRLLWRIEGMLEAVHTRPRLVLARHPVKPLWDALWVVDGRVADWGPVPDDDAEIEQRTAAALAKRRGQVVVPAGEIDEVRIVASWLARNEPAVLELTDLRDGEAAAWVSSVASAPDSADTGSLALSA